MSIQGHDQWKTASPHDDHDDTRCFYCGAPVPESDEAWVYEGFCCEECGALAGTDAQHRLGTHEATGEDDA
jgi:hypothetical protein